MDEAIRKIEDVTTAQNRAAQAAAPAAKDATVEVKGCVRYPGKIQHDEDSAPVAAKPAPKP
ncbi:MAG TPA: hypothetical protein VGD95_02910 [Micavibrio sp.]